MIRDNVGPSGVIAVIVREPIEDVRPAFTPDGCLVCPQRKIHVFVVGRVGKSLVRAVDEQPILPANAVVSVRVEWEQGFRGVEIRIRSPRSTADTSVTRDVLPIHVIAFHVPYLAGMIRL